MHEEECRECEKYGGNKKRENIQQMKLKNRFWNVRKEEAAMAAMVEHRVQGAEKWLKTV